MDNAARAHCNIYYTLIANDPTETKTTKSGSSWTAIRTKAESSSNSEVIYDDEETRSEPSGTAGSKSEVVNSEIVKTISEESRSDFYADSSRRSSLSDLDASRFPTTFGTTSRRSDATPGLERQRVKYLTLAHLQVGSGREISTNMLGPGLSQFLPHPPLSEYSASDIDGQAVGENDDNDSKDDRDSILKGSESHDDDNDSKDDGDFILKGFESQFSERKKHSLDDEPSGNAAVAGQEGGTRGLSQIEVVVLSPESSNEELQRGEEEEVKVHTEPAIPHRRHQMLTPIPMWEEFRVRRLLFSYHDSRAFTTSVGATCNVVIGGGSDGGLCLQGNFKRGFTMHGNLCPRYTFPHTTPNLGGTQNRGNNGESEGIVHALYPASMEAARS